MPERRAPFDGQRYFFDGGLRFECTGCGDCCRGAPGIVRIDENEVDRAAALLGITPEAFVTDYTRPLGEEDGLALREHPEGACIFLAPDQRCRLYAARPPQCRTYPFWLRNLRSEAAWRRTCGECPGIGRGPLHSRESILAKIAGEPEPTR